MGVPTGYDPVADDAAVLPFHLCLCLPKNAGYQIASFDIRTPTVEDRVHLIGDDYANSRLPMC